MSERKLLGYVAVTSGVLKIDDITNQVDEYAIEVTTPHRVGSYPVYEVTTATSVEIVIDLTPDSEAGADSGVEPLISMTHDPSSDWKPREIRVGEPIAA